MIKTLFCAAVTAAVIDGALPPRQAPPVPADKFISAPELGQALANLTASPTAMSVAFPEQRSTITSGTASG